MRIVALILTVVAGVFPLALVSAEESGSKPGVEKSADRIKQIEQERIATLKAAAETAAALHEIGQAPTEEVLEAMVLVHEAELDAVEKEADRIAGLQGLVKVLRELEETAKARKAAARGTEAAALRAKARRLEAELRLERANQQAQRHAKNNDPQQGKVEVASVQAKDIVVAEQFVCQVRSRRHIDVRSLQSGYLEEIHAKEGQAVKQGDVIFKLSPVLYQARLDAELAEVEVAALNLKTTERLFQNKLVAEEEVAQSRAKLAGAQAKAKLAQAELDLTIVRAPFDGIVDRMQQQEGSLVTERDVLTTLSDNREMWVYFNVPLTRYLQYMTLPAKDRTLGVELVLAGDRKFPQPGKVAAIDGQFDEQTGTIAFRADFPNSDALLRHGMTGNVRIQRTVASAIVIPQQATFELLDQRYVYVVDKEGVAQRREIVVQSELQDGFVIEKGLDVNDKIVLEGVRQIRDGEKLEYELRKP